MSAEKISYELKRYAGIKRDYTDEEVERLRGSIKIEYSLCKNQSEKLWKLLNTEAYVNTLGSLSGNQAVQHAKAGLKAIYLSGWQVAADANTAGEMYPDQSLYPYDSGRLESPNHSTSTDDSSLDRLRLSAKSNVFSSSDSALPLTTPSDFLSIF